MTVVFGRVPVWAALAATVLVACESRDEDEGSDTFEDDDAADDDEVRGGQAGAARGGAGGMGGGTLGRGGAGGSGTGGSAVAGSGGAAAAGAGGSAGGPTPIDAGAGGMAVQDASVDEPLLGGASRCGGGDLPLCYGFERGVLDPAFVSKGSNVKVEKGRAARGEWSLHYANLGTAKPTIETKTLTGITNVLWGRVFLYLTPAAPKGHGALFNGHDQAGNWYEVGFQFRNYHGNWHVPQGVPERWMNSATPIPGNRWVCVEWVFDGAKPDVTRIYSDGALVSYTQSASSPGPAKVQRFDKLVLGFIPYHGSDATDLWLDELAIGPTRIGCDR